jgi:glutaredoxin 2
MRHFKLGQNGKQLAGHQLYYFSTCPYCIAVRLVLWWQGRKVPLKDILFHPDNNTDLIAGGGKGQVPCLRIESENGSVEWMYESMDIIRYLRSTATP